ncbi:hypothetical protein GF420_00025 [candidate division GN15 bacterium]|nr:hypothetical protein [candidate division GN15 bacterium]
MNSSDLLQIQILPVEQIYPFEQSATETDSGGDEEARLVRDPFPVIDLNGEGYLLLEDADRLAAATRAGLMHVPVQIARESGLKITCDTLVLPGFEREDLRELAARHPEEILLGADEGTDPDGYHVVHFNFDGSNIQTVLLRHSGRVGCPEGLTRLFASITDTGRYVPLVEATTRRDQLLKGADQAPTLTLSSFTLADLRMAAVSGDLFPRQIIRVIPECRAIAIDFPVSVLMADIPVEEKQAFLHDLISLREQANRTSVVEGRVYILNR